MTWARARPSTSALVNAHVERFLFIERTRGAARFDIVAFTLATTSFNIAPLALGRINEHFANPRASHGDAESVIKVAFAHATRMHSWRVEASATGPSSNSRQAAFAGGVYRHQAEYFQQLTSKGGPLLDKGEGPL